MVRTTADANSRFPDTCTDLDSRRISIYLFTYSQRSAGSLTVPYRYCYMHGIMWRQLLSYAIICISNIRLEIHTYVSSFENACSKMALKISIRYPGLIDSFKCETRTRSHVWKNSFDYSYLFFTLFSFYFCLGSYYISMDMYSCSYLI